MSLRSTYHLQNSLPNRSPTQAPRSLSLSEYQPLSFDREALEAAYQNTIGSGSNSSCTAPTSTSFGQSSNETDETTPSTLSHDLKAGDNPHGMATPPTTNHAGVGAGHSLTPPHSPFHSAGKGQQQSLLSPVPGSPVPPTPPPRPEAIPPSTFRRPSASGVGMRRSASAMDVDDPESSGHVDRPSKGKRRALPTVPTDVPAPEPPQWEPDFKAHIPSQLTAPSAANAYASLSAPPPNLPPRRTQPLRHSASPERPFSRTTRSTGNSAAGRTSLAGGEPVASGSGARPADVPMAVEPESTEPRNMDAPVSPVQPRTDRPHPERDVYLRATEKTPIWSTHYLDPCLRNASVSLPRQVTNVANIALTGLSTGPKTRYNSSIGAPIDGLARAMKDWTVAPDALFSSEQGGIEVAVAVVDGGGEEWGKESGRKKARVEAVSKGGGIKVDVIELDGNRQIDLRVETKTGDVLVLLPNTFHGPIHITSPAHAPQFLPVLFPQLEPIVNPYAAFYTTYAVPAHLVNDPEARRNLEHRVASGVQRYAPKSMRQQSGMLDQVVGGFSSHTRGEQSKVTVQSSKGKVVVGYRETADEEAAKTMGLVVGGQAPKKKKRWWR